MSLLLLILLAITHFATGYGMLALFNIKLNRALSIPLSFIMGIFVAAFSIFLLQLCYIPLTSLSVFGVVVLAALLLNIKSLLHFRQINFRFSAPAGIKVYEWPFLLMVAVMLLITVWRCYYLPPHARDLLSGPEVIAEFAITEHSFINSVFSLDLSTTNNQYKSPFLHALQLLYKLAGFPYGGLWLSMITLSFYVFIYALLREIIHPIIAGFLILLLISAPELYGYSFLVLYDYSNMVFFFLACYFLLGYLNNPSARNQLLLSSLLFAMSVYIRSETLMLLMMLVPLLLMAAPLNKSTFKKQVIKAGILVVPSFVAYLLVIQLYNNYYLPSAYSIKGLVNEDLSNLQPLWQRFTDVWQSLVISKKSLTLYGYLFFVFFAALIPDFIFFQKLSRNGFFWCYTVAVVLIGLCIIGFIFPLMDIEHSTKRGLFKALPLIIFYLANNQLLQKASQKISAWENRNDAILQSKS